MLPAVASMIVPPGREPALPLGLLDHRDADAVLDAPARVDRLELHQTFAGTPAASRRSGISGVRPIAWRTLGVIPVAVGNGAASARMRLARMVPSVCLGSVPRYRDSDSSGQV